VAAEPGFRVTAGSLNERIAIQARVNDENSRGEKTYTYATFSTVWAEANPKKGREFMAASQLQGEGPAVFKIRYRTDLDRTMRVVWKGVTYELKSPPVDEHNTREWLYLYCTSGTGDARKLG
jgi:SPP1 family predicted phage head-tail adaptor